MRKSFEIATMAREINKPLPKKVYREFIRILQSQPENSTTVVKINLGQLTFKLDHRFEGKSLDDLRAIPGTTLENGFLVIKEISEALKFFTDILQNKLKPEAKKDILNPELKKGILGLINNFRYNTPGGRSSNFTLSDIPYIDDQLRKQAIDYMLATRIARTSNLKIEGQEVYILNYPAIDKNKELKSS